MNFNQQRKLLLEQQRREQQWSARQAERQMQFQAQQSSTAHQREVQDLIKAGLNPILSAQGAGAAAGNGAMAQSDSIVPALADLLRASHSGGGGTKVIVNNEPPEDPRKNRPEWSPVTSPHSHTTHSASEVKETSYEQDVRDNTWNLRRDLGQAVKDFHDQIEEANIRVSAGVSGRTGLRGSLSGTANKMIDSLNALASLSKNSSKGVWKFVKSQYAAAKREVERTVDGLPKDQQKAFWEAFYRN